MKACHGVNINNDAYNILVKLKIICLVDNFYSGNWFSSWFVVFSLLPSIVQLFIEDSNN